MPKTVTKYQCADGKLFDSKPEADAHEFAIEALEKMHNYQAKDAYHGLVWLHKNMERMGLTYLPNAKE